MLAEKRIREAKENVRSYLEDGMLFKSGFEGIVFRVLKENAKESLEVATSSRRAENRICGP